MRPFGPNHLRLVPTTASPAQKAAAGGSVSVRPAGETADPTDPAMQVGGIVQRVLRAARLDPRSHSASERWLALPKTARLAAAASVLSADTSVTAAELKRATDAYALAYRAVSTQLTE